MASTLAERLQSKLKRMPSGCLEFTGGRNKAGYGNIYTHSIGRKTVTTCAHRAAYEIHVGPIPEGSDVLHHCDNPPCCEPLHLFLGTQADNMKDKAAKGRAQPGPVSRREWWTPERRAERSRNQQARVAARQKAERAAAGVPSNWKRCPSCETWLSPDKFNQNPARHDGLAPHCLQCRRRDKL